MMLAKIFRELELGGEESSDDDADDFPKLVGTTIIMPQKELLDLMKHDAILGVVVAVTAQMAGPETTTAHAVFYIGSTPPSLLIR